MKWRWLTAAALAMYCLWSALLIAQRPGLQYDEALLAAGAIVLRNPPLLPALSRHPGTWACPADVCFPLMAEDRYIGAIKEYLAVPAFAMLGNRASSVRLVSVLLALIGLWGIAKLLNEQAGPPIGSAVALTLAIHPSFLTMTVFDNGGVAATMAALGLGCAALSAYLLKQTGWAAFWLGAAAGFGIWTRANFIWTLAAVALAIALVLMRRSLPPWRHVLLLAIGGITGGFPFLWYQVLSSGGTLGAFNSFRIQEPWGAMLSNRTFMLSEALLVDGEHRVMWGNSAIPGWQLWLFPTLTIAACVVALFFGKKKGERWPIGQAVSGAFLLLVAFLFSSRIQMAEHHLIAAVPLAAAVVVLAGAIVYRRLAGGKIVIGLLIATYGACALYWNVRAVQGLRDTGGLGVWSDAINQLTVEVQTRGAGRYVKILDWGFERNFFVLSGGIIRSVELADAANPSLSSSGKSWAEEIREGGLFVVSGENNRSFPGPVEAFLMTLAETNPAIERRRLITDRSGNRFAQLLDIRPNSIGEGSNDSGEIRIDIGKPDSGNLLSGFHEPEEGGWRWTQHHFSATFEHVNASDGTPWLRLEGYLPESSIQMVGPMTLAGKVGANGLAPATYSQAGNFTYSRRLDPAWFAGGKAVVEFDLDKWRRATAADARELGVVVRSIAIEVR